MDLLRIGVEGSINETCIHQITQSTSKRKGKQWKTISRVLRVSKKFSKQTSETGNGERVFPNYVQISNHYFDVNGFGYNKTVRLQHILTPRTGQKQQAFELWPASKGNFITNLRTVWFCKQATISQQPAHVATVQREHLPDWLPPSKRLPHARLAAPALHMKAISLTCGYLYHCYTTFVGYSWFYLLFGFIWIEWCICHSNISIL